MSREVVGFDQLVAEGLPGLVRDLLARDQGKLYRTAMDRVERPLLALVLEATGGNQLRAARLLGINRNTLRKRLRLLGLAAPRQRRTARMWTSSGVTS
jgi:two-component system nitrogen regulation response regulator GlnG